MSIFEFQTKVKKVIDDLKALTTELGLGNTGVEYKIISELFTYKFLNDKCMFLLKKYVEENNIENIEKITEDEYEDFIMLNLGTMAVIEKEDLLFNLYNKINVSDDMNIDEIFDQVLENINNNENNEDYKIKTATGETHNLFEPLNSYINDKKKTKILAKRTISILNDTSFENMFKEGNTFDFFSTIFEYLIQDYNKDSGKYAEYYTPSFAGDIIAKILVGKETNLVEKSLYDAAAGSGTLLMRLKNLIGEDNCTIYSQDISQKSTNFLRLNLILNNLTSSLGNIIEGNTLSDPQHLEDGKLKKFDFIVSNPPFKVDFSNIVKDLEGDQYNRFFAGIPSIPPTKKDSMAIYLMFIQHIIASLKDNGKAALVLPTGFCTAQSKIEKAIREHLIENNMLSGVVDMPSNIFANTGTSVSILFIDKSKTDTNVILVDATKLGKKVKADSGQKTELSQEEQQRIVDVSIARENVEDMAILVENEKIKENGYSFKAGQYFEHKVEKLDVDFDTRMKELSSNLFVQMNESVKLNEIIKSNLEVLGYGEKR